MAKKNDDRENLDDLFAQAGYYRRSKDFCDLLRFIKKFPHYSPYNAMLLHTQKPGCRYVASINKWRKIGRSLKPNARPLFILQPFGPVNFVYELEDTEADPIPEHIMNPFHTRSFILDEPYYDIGQKYQILCDNLPCLGVRLSLSHEGSLARSYAGHIEVNDYAQNTMNYRGKKIFLPYNMLLNQALDIPTKITTIAHELGHLLCKHLPHYAIEKSPETIKTLTWRKGDRNNLDKGTKEFEAESVAYMVSLRLGLDSNSAEYLSGYMPDELIPSISLDKVLKAAGTIGNMLNKEQKIEKNLIIADLSPRESSLF